MTETTTTVSRQVRRQAARLLAKHERKVANAKRGAFDPRAERRVPYAERYPSIYAPHHGRKERGHQTARGGHGRG